MDVWATLWGGFLVVVLFVFTLLAIGVTIGGFFDVKSLFASMQQKHDEKKDEA